MPFADFGRPVLMCGCLVGVVYAVSSLQASAGCQVRGFSVRVLSFDTVYFACR